MLLWEIPTMGESEMSDFENKELRITATGESVMVTKEDVEKARAAWHAAEKTYAVWDFAKEAEAADHNAEDAWDNYQKLKQEFEKNENGN
jgi:hypothetical protein